MALQLLPQDLLGGDEMSHSQQCKRGPELVKRLLCCALTVSLLEAPEAGAFEWSGRSDVYLERRYGAGLFSGADQAAWHYESTDIGWGYRFGDSSLYANGVFRARQPADFEVSAHASGSRVQMAGSGYGFGLGLRGDWMRIEVGGLRDHLAVKPLGGDGLLPDPSQAPRGSTESLAGGYVRVGVDLFQWSHFLVQANAQLEELHRVSSNYSDMDVPRQHYAASAGLSIHATDINTVIPVAVAVTALIIAACMKGCKGLGNSPGNWHSSGSRRDCDKKDGKGCER